MLFEADQDDDLGLRKLISWAEDGWAVIGFFWLIIYPLVVLAILGIVLGGCLPAQKSISNIKKKNPVFPVVGVLKKTTPQPPSATVATLPSMPQ